MSFSFTQHIFEIKKHEWHSISLSNQLEKKLDKLLVNSWNAYIILAYDLFILGYSYSSFNCCPKSYQVTCVQEPDAGGGGPGRSNWFTYKPENQLAFFFFKKKRNVFPKWVRNLKSLVTVHHTNLLNESVQWKTLSEGCGLQRNHLIHSLLWKESWRPNRQE